MQLLAAIQTLGSILQLIRELSGTASGANGSKLNAVITALQRLAESAIQVQGILLRAVNEGRDELTQEERDEIRKMDDRAREAQVAAINAASDESGDPVEQQRQAAQARKQQQGGAARPEPEGFKAARTAAEERGKSR
jgi:hypothetical protein